MLINQKRSSEVNERIIHMILCEPIKDYKIYEIYDSFSFITFADTVSGYFTESFCLQNLRIGDKSITVTRFLCYSGSASLV